MRWCWVCGTMFSTPSFRDGALAPDPESRDSGFDASHRPGMTGRLLPRRGALHGRLAFRIRGPQFHPSAGVVGVDAELAAFEQRLQPAIAKFLRRRTAMKLCGQF